MPYTMQVDGMDMIAQMLEKTGEAAQSIAARALYNGAGAVADEISKEARGLQTSNAFWFAHGGKQRYPSPEEKRAVESAGLGIAKFRKTGNDVNTSIGYGGSGYCTINGKRKPIAVIANSINSGTSFMKKQPFIRKAATQAKATVEILNEVTRLVGEIMK